MQIFRLSLAIVLMPLAAGFSLPTIAADDNKTIVLTPVSHVALLDSKYYIPADTYTRLVICGDFVDHTDCSSAPNAKATPDLDDTDQPLLAYKSRGWLARALVGIGHSENLTVNVKAGHFVASVPLVSLSHDSTKSSGEVFTRSVYYKAMDYPLFLVRGTSDGEVAQADIKMGATDKVTSYAAASTLSAVLAVTRQLVSPPPVLTNLAVDSNKAVASSIDKTISSLFGVSINEEQIEEQKIARWRDVLIVLRIPNREGGWNDPNNPNTHPKIMSDLAYGFAGKWRLYFDYPHVSAFSTEIVKCQLDSKGTIDSVIDRSGAKVEQKDDKGVALDGEGNCNYQINAERNLARADVLTHLADVLNFPVIVNHDNPVTIGDLLKQQDWWKDSLAAIALTNPNSSDVDTYCREIRTTMGDQGFNTLDQYLVVAAVRQSSLVKPEQGAALTTAGCIDPNSTDPADKAALAALKSATPAPAAQAQKPAAGAPVVAAPAHGAPPTKGKAR